MEMAGFVSRAKEQVISQILLGLIFLGSWLVITALQALLFVLVKPFSLWWYRKLGWYLSLTFHNHFVFFVTWWGNVDLAVCAESAEVLQNYFGKEHVLFIGNHHHGVDVAIFWTVMDQLKLSANLKIVGKKALSYLPILGWFWTLQEHIFVDRNWKIDQRVLAKKINHLFKHDPVPVLIAITPEGTRYTEEKHAQSMLVAKSKGLRELKHHLLPRTRGFVYIRQQIAQNKDNVPAIYDGTLVTELLSENPPTVTSVLNGRGFICKGLLRRFPMKDIPCEKESCERWLHALFQEKDAFMEEFYQTGKVPSCFKHTVQVQKSIGCLINFVCWAILILVPFCYWLIKGLILGNYFYLNVLGLIILTGRFGVKALADLQNTEKSSTYGKLE